MYGKYDRNNDGIIDLSEFEAIANRISNSQPNQEFYKLPIEIGKEYITLNAYFEPIQIETMSKNENTFSSLISETKSLKFLKEWKKTFFPQINLPTKSFHGFLPKDPVSVKIGEMWDLIPVKKNDFYENLSNNRYQPPDLNDEQEIVVFKILQMFHKNVFLNPRFPPKGISLILRAQNDEYFDILFRIHAEFQLNEPPYFPFWFTPASFMGRLVINKIGNHIKYFNVFVPNSKRLNVDMEWLNEMIDGEENMEVDIGFMPRMEVISSRESILLEENMSVDFMKVSENNLLENFEDLRWSEEIDIEDGYSELEIKFYPFKKVKYFSYLEAFKEATKMNKLVHFIMLWGALDDQSC